MKSLYFLSFNSYYFTYYVIGAFLDPEYTVVTEHTKKKKILALMKIIFFLNETEKS